MNNSLQIEWYPLSARLRTDYVNKIKRQATELYDSYISLGSITIERESGFEIERSFSREMPYPNNFQNAITYELSITQRHNLRQVYSLFDFLADIGGFFSTIGALCVAMVSVFQYYGPYQFLMAGLFFSRKDNDENKNKKKPEVNKVPEQAIKIHNDVQWNSCKALLLNL